jgi:hypothetical protein
VNIVTASLPLPLDYLNSVQQRLVKDSGLVVWRCGFVQPGVAGQQTMWQVFFPPAAAGRLLQFAVFARSYSVTTVNEVRRLDTPLGGTPAGLLVHDQRLVQTPLAIVSSTTGALPGAAGPVLTVGHSVTPDILTIVTLYERGFILAPGQGVLSITQTVNVEARVMLVGIEMPEITNQDSFKRALLKEYGF